MVIVGAGPVGLVTALSLAREGIATTVLEQRPGLEPFGSRAVVIERSALEVLDRVGCAAEILERGVTWTLGRTYYGDRELFQIRFPQIGQDALPPFVNLPQYQTEEILLKAAAGTGLVTLRWGHRVVAVQPAVGGVTVEYTSADGDGSLQAAYLVACDGARSAVRDLLGLELGGYTYEQGRFLIADIRAKLPFERERRFWFNPKHLPGIKVLIMHPQPDDVWRIDGQVEDDADIEEDRRSGRLERRIRSVIGDAPYEIVWLSLWTFHERMLERFRHGRVFFAGDSAHLVSPFGGRGMNSGVHDAENLAWKLALVLRGVAPDALLDAYDHERVAAARENVAVTKRTMEFLVPTTWRQRIRRTVILRASLWCKPLRRYVDSGKLHVPAVYAGSPIVQAAPAPAPAPALVPGQLAPDGPCAVEPGAEAGPDRLRVLFRDGFTALVFGPVPDDARRALERAVIEHDVPCRLWNVVAAGTAPPAGPEPVVVDVDGVLVSTYVTSPDRRFYLVRPDGHIAASGPVPGPEELGALLDRSTARR